MPYGFRIERDTTVAAQKLYDRLADVAAWDQWAPMVSRSELVQSGATDPLGAGAIRRMQGLGGLLTVDEEILEATSPSYQRYTAVRGYQPTTTEERSTSTRWTVGHMSFGPANSSLASPVPARY
jgi:hypothetical protein